MKIHQNKYGEKRIERIEDLDPSTYYIQNQLTGIVFDDGKRAYAELIALRKDAKINVIKDTTTSKRIRYLFSGKDIIAFLKNKNIEIDNNNRIANDLLKDMSESNKVNMVIEFGIIKENIRIKDIENKKLLTENKLLKDSISDIQKREKQLTNSEFQANIMSKAIIDNIFDSKKIYVIEKITIEDFCGIYFLLKEKKIVYIGQSVNIFSRINAHTKDKDFDEVRFFKCQREDLDKVEIFFIKLIKPELNGAYKFGEIPDLESYCFANAEIMSTPYGPPMNHP